ncbi:unnamed protein product, partial [Ectocarpus sp. 8 AP-2014]
NAARPLVRNQQVAHPQGFGMQLHRSWGVHHTVALGLALCSHSSESFGPIDPAVVYSSRGQHHRRATTQELRSSTSPLPPPDSRSGTTSSPPPPRELIERERERWGHGTARAVERGVDNRSRKGGGRGGGAKKKSGPRRPRAKGDRGRGPMVLRWRMFNVELGVKVDPGKDFCGVSAELLEVVAGRLGIKDEGMLADTDVVVVRKSFDARTKKDAEPRFSYTLDVRLSPKTARKLRLRTKQGKLEPSPSGGPLFPASPSSDSSVFSDISPDVTSAAVSKMAALSDATSAAVAAEAIAADAAAVAGAGAAEGNVTEGTGAPLLATGGGGRGPSVVIVGAGPAGLFAALELVEVGMKPIIVERGMPVERRGREIGALFHRRILNPDSNLCYGEGGAGTWSDGKLTTRIGRNSENVRKVLETLVAHGAPERILVDGKPHLGTDR